MIDPAELARLRALLAKATPPIRYDAEEVQRLAARSDAFAAALAEIVVALPALLDAADPETLRFGPRTKHGWRTAVAADGETYSICAGDGFFVLSSVDAFEHGDGSNAFKTEAEAIEAAREHDRARRGAK